MAYNDDLINTIDARIASASESFRTMAVAVGDSVEQWANVVFHGATVAVPVRVFGTLRVLDGDLVGVMKFGNDWIVTQTYNRMVRNQVAIAGAWTNASTSSGTFVDAPGPINFSFTKVYSATTLECVFITSMYVGAQPSRGIWAININGSDVFTTLLHATVALDHAFAVSSTQITGIPAGTYTVTLRWRLSTGTGPVQVDTNDIYRVTLEEMY